MMVKPWPEENVSVCGWWKQPASRCSPIRPTHNSHEQRERVQYTSASYDKWLVWLTIKQKTDSPVQMQQMRGDFVCVANKMLLFCNKCVGSQRTKKLWSTEEWIKPNALVHLTAACLPVVLNSQSLSGKSHSISTSSADDVSGPLWLWSQHNSCFWCQPNQMSTAVLILDRWPKK